MCEDDFITVLKYHALMPAQLELLFTLHNQGLDAGLHDQGYENVAPVVNASGGISFLSFVSSRGSKNWKISLCDGWISGGRALLGADGR